MSLDVSPELLAQAEAGDIDPAAFLDTVRENEPGYYCRPVPAFGDPKARLLIVGLAPGMHGANRTGRPFTGDHAGILLYQTLHKFGLASGPISDRKSVV